jgi:hypothetical protein
VKRYIRADGLVIWARAEALFKRTRRGDTYVTGSIQTVLPDPDLAACRRRDFVVFKALEAWGALTTTRQPIAR